MMNKAYQYVLKEKDHSVVLPGLNRGLYLVPKVSFRAKKVDGCAAGRPRAAVGAA